MPVDYTGDGNLPPRVLDMSAIPAAAPGAGGMPGGMMAMPGMPPSGAGTPATADQEVGDQIKSEITVGGKKNKTHYGKKFGKKHKSAMLDFTKSLWMQDAAASLKNVLKSEVCSLFRSYARRLISHSLCHEQSLWNTDKTSWTLYSSCASTQRSMRCTCAGCPIATVKMTLALRNTAAKPH